MMNKRLVIMLILMLSLFTGCSKQEEILNQLVVESDFVKYKVENLTAYSVDDEGALYAAGFKNVDDAPMLEIITFINKYDLEGNLLFSHSFDDTILSIDGLAVNGNKIFFTASGHNKDGVCLSLYCYDIESDSLERLEDFNFFVSAKQLIYNENRVYILGLKQYSTTRTNLTEEAYQSEGEKLVYYSLDDNMVYEMDINIPISMALNEDGTLMLLSYMDSQGYCLMQYDSKEDSIEVIANFKSYKFENFAVCNEGKSILYTYNINPRGLVMSDILAMDEEAELYSDAAVFNFGIFYRKGQIYCMTAARDLVRFSLNTIQKENRTIRYISQGYQVNEPFGCGYSMERTELEEDKFALKVLAQDKDYDLCLMSSSSYTSYNIRDNGVFYPLNKVKGIDEYLNACFPYVKEIATDEHGDIWMLPIGVDIPGLLVNEECLEKEQIHLKNNMTYEEFYQVIEGMSQEQFKMTDCNPPLIYRSFLAQFFNKPINIDYDVLSNKLELLQKYNKCMPRGANAIIDWTEKPGEFLYAYCNEYFFELMMSRKYGDNALRIYSMPKLEASDKNYGTCSFLAVNANSDNLKETLVYLAELISYSMEQENVPLFFQQPILEEVSLKRSLYDLYENGAISFYLDRDLYVDGFFDVIENQGNISNYIEETKRKLTTYFNE